jgi:hypothetical protein
MKPVRILWTIAGFLVGPAVPSVLLLFLSAFRDRAESLGNFAAFLLLSYAVTVPIVAIVGVPAMAWAERHNMARWWVAVIAGAMCGAIFTWTFYSQDPPLTAVGEFAFWGASIAISVWGFSRLGKLHERRLTANNSFKPNPLRRSA